MDRYLDQPMDQFLASRRYTTWHLIKLYSQSDRCPPASLFFSIVILMTMTFVGFEALFSYWYNYFYDALQAYDHHHIIRFLIVFFVITGFYLILAFYRFYISRLLDSRWRRWVSQQSMDLISAIATFFALLYILWELSGELTISLGYLGTIQISGFWVWVGLMYALIASLFTFKMGNNRVSKLSVNQFTLDFPASINFRSCEKHDSFKLDSKKSRHYSYRSFFNNWLKNSYITFLRQKFLMWFAASSNQASVVLPLLVALPHYFDKVFLIGFFIQSIQAFGRIQESLSYMLQSQMEFPECREFPDR